MRNIKWEKYIFEFISIFIAVIAAFSLNNWKEKREDRELEKKILIEINNGLKLDAEEVDINISAHQKGIEACRFWRDIIQNNATKQDSLYRKYIRLTRDVIFIHNTSGYEALKSKGLGLIENDSLRFSIIKLYEYDYSNVKKLEDTYEEMQFQKNYFHEINYILSPYFSYAGEKGYLSKINYPIDITNNEKNRLLSYLMKIESNRRTMLFYYNDIKSKVETLQRDIKTISEK